MANLKLTPEQRQWVERQLREGRTYPWIVAELAKEGTRVTPGAIGYIREQANIPRRKAKNHPEVTPWKVKEEHRFKAPMRMLDQENRRLSDLPYDEDALNKWKEELEEAGAVVAYYPDTDDGFFYVPRLPEDGTGLVRLPNESP